MLINTYTNFWTDLTKKKASFFARDIQKSVHADQEGLVFTTVLLNQGSGYSNVSGVYTVPVGGTYLVMATLHGTRYQSSLNVTRVALVVDGEDQMEAATTVSTDYYFETMSLSAVLLLAEDQKASGKNGYFWPRNFKISIRV